MYQIIQDKKGLAVIKGRCNGYSVLYDKGSFSDFEQVRKYFIENYKGLCVGLRTNFNSGERITLLRILWEGYKGINEQIRDAYRQKFELVIQNH